MTPLTTEREYDVVVKALDERVKLTEALKKSHKDLVTMIDNTVYFKFVREAVRQKFEVFYKHVVMATIGEQLKTTTVNAGVVEKLKAEWETLCYVLPDNKELKQDIEHYNKRLAKVDAVIILINEANLFED